MGLDLKSVVGGDEEDVAGRQIVSMHQTKGDECNPHQVEFRLRGQPQSVVGIWW